MYTNDDNNNKYCLMSRAPRSTFDVVSAAHVTVSGGPPSRSSGRGG